MTSCNRLSQRENVQGEPVYSYTSLLFGSIWTQDVTQYGSTVYIGTSPILT